MIAAGSTLPFYNESALAQLSQVRGAPADAVMINANENPLGPCAEAAEAMRNIIQKGGRYKYGETDDFKSTLAEQEGLKPSYVQAFAGSSAPLHQAVLAFTSPTKPYVMADPGYEAGGSAAQFIGAKVIKVPLTKTYAHDVKAMAAADPNAGLIYLCNPNNPTGTLTPKEDIEWLVDNKPKGCILMIDEAYTHISGAPFSTDLVAKDKDVIILRTFSKIYGMAGLRAGAAMAKPDLLEKLGHYSAGRDADHGHGRGARQPEGEEPGAGAAQDHQGRSRRRVRVHGQEQLQVRAVGVEQVHGRHGPAGERHDHGAADGEGVYRPRVAGVAHHVRVSIGTQDEMNKFKAAYLKVMKA